VNPNLKPEVLAPGAGIISTAPGTTYYRSSGTSGATVFIAGTLALILEEFPNMSRSGGSHNSDCIVAMKQALMDSIDPEIAEVEHDGALGYGNLDAVAWFEVVETQQASNPCIV
jgi:subtilisin family serine protease